MEQTKCNFHTHVCRCGHAAGTEEDYVKAALSAGLSQLGFSDHGPFPDIDFGLRMPFEELGEYLDAVDALAAQYQNDIILWKGLEIEYLSEYRSYYEDLLTKWGVDYLLLGEHYFKDADGNITNIYGPLSSTEQFLPYARDIAEGMKTGFFRVVAHPDVYMINCFGWDKNCEKAADLILDAAAATDTILEYNANGFRRKTKDYPDGTRHPYPHEAFWKMAAQAHVKTIVGSDCHNPENLWDEAMRRSYRNLRELGIEPMTEFLILPHR